MEPFPRIFLTVALNANFAAEFNGCREAKFPKSPRDTAGFEVSSTVASWPSKAEARKFAISLLPRKRGFLRTVSLDVYSSNAVRGQFVNRKSAAISFFHMKILLDLMYTMSLARCNRFMACERL